MGRLKREDFYAPPGDRVIVITRRSSQNSKWLPRSDEIIKPNGRPLRPHDTHYHRSLDALGYLGWEANNSGRVWYSAAFRRFIGAPAWAAIDPWGFVQFIHIEDRHRYLDDYIDAYVRRRPFMHEARFWHEPSKCYHWLRSMARPFAGYSMMGASIDLQAARNAASMARELRAQERRAHLLVTNSAHLMMKCAWETQRCRALAEPAD